MGETKQLTLAVGNGFEKHGRATFKAEFLSRMEGLMLWAEFCALIEPHYPKAVNVEPLLPASYWRTRSSYHGIAPEAPADAWLDATAAAE